MTAMNRMRTGWRTQWSFLAACLAVFLCLDAFAADLASAKSDGWIGEKPDGYIGLVRGDAPADIQALVSEVNAKRKEAYQRIASQQGAPLSEVEKVGGKTAIEKTRPGDYVMDTAGRWRKK
jgi:uncharacterized protein YdbL (DUF1318 family)